MSELKIQYEQVVSGTNRTLQYFDFLAQTLEQMIAMQDCDKNTLCELLKQFATSQQWKLEEPIGQLLNSSPKAQSKSNNKEQ